MGGEREEEREKERETCVVCVRKTRLFQLRSQPLTKPLKFNVYDLAKEKLSP